MTDKKHITRRQWHIEVEEKDKDGKVVIVHKWREPGEIGDYTDVPGAIGYADGVERPTLLSIGTIEVYNEPLKSAEQGVADMTAALSLHPVHLNPDDPNWQHIASTYNAPDDAIAPITDPNEGGR